MQSRSLYSIFAERNDGDDFLSCTFISWHVDRAPALLSMRTHSQQNQQPVDIWQSALRHEGYSETERKREGATRERQRESERVGMTRVRETTTTTTRGRQERGTSELSREQVHCGYERRYRWKRYGSTLPYEASSASLSSFRMKLRIPEFHMYARMCVWCVSRHATQLA